MQIVNKTEPYYIRCVKPNNNKSPHDFDAPMVMEQLRCNGTLEMVRIRREGYPMREEWKVRTCKESQRQAGNTTITIETRLHDER